MKSKDYFYALANRLQSSLEDREKFTSWYSGENSDFIRFNHAKVRQAGSVSQAVLSFSLISDGKQCAASFEVSGDLEEDGNSIESLVKSLRLKLRVAPKDPYLFYAEKVNSSEREEESLLDSAEHIVDSLLTLGKDLDLVGIHAQGVLERGFANSYGQRNWFSKHNFNLDFSAYHKDDKAVKSSYSGFAFDREHLEQELNLMREKLAVLEKTPKTLKPGAYKAYLSPSAVHELLNMLSWGGFSEKSVRSKQSCLDKLRNGIKLNPIVSINENTAKSTGPLFQENGFIKPDSIALIKNGELLHTMISPRTAKEYNLESNGSDSSEAPQAYEIMPGNLERDSILKELGTGIYIGNLWYLNFSDRMSGRITGMTRFATFWIEDGKIKAPLNVMRFDDSLLSLFGEKLLALTKQLEFILDPSTYEERSTASVRVPGMLVSDFNLTL